MLKNENSKIEFKERLNEHFEEEVVAFLNYKDGGIIYIGIDKNGEAVGLDDIDDVQLKIKDRIKNNILPSTIGLFDISVEVKDDIEVIKLAISSGIEKPYYIKKKGMTPAGCYIRVGSSKEQLTNRMINEMFAKRIKNPLKELESPRQKLTFNQLKIHYEGKNVKLTDKFLENLDLLTSEGKYNYNAFLLADENNVSIKVVKYNGTTKSELEKNEEYGYRCLITATQQVLNKLEVENDTYAKIGHLKREEVKKFSPVAVREAIINAMIHNDYSYGNSPIIEFYSDRVEITSTGGLPEGLSKEEFLEGVTLRRNAELIRVFKDVELIENIGSGVLRILESYDKSCFKFMEHFLRVSFKYKENPFTYSVEKHSTTPITTPNTTPNTTPILNIDIWDNLTESQRNILILINENDKISQKQISDKLNITLDGVKYNTKILKDLKVLEREGNSKKGSWKIVE